VGLLGTDVPDAVRRSGRNEHPTAGADDEGFLPDPELELAVEHLEELFLGRVHVGCGDRAVRLDVRVHDDAFAVRLGGGRAEDERLSGDGIRDASAGYPIHSLSQSSTVNSSCVGPAPSSHDVAKTESALATKSPTGRGHVPEHGMNAK
jgi:hypothetical protein